MKKKEITIKRLETRYILTDEKGNSISVIVSGNEESLSIYRQTYFNLPFEFVGSRPETVRTIIDLLFEATKLANLKEK